MGWVYLPLYQKPPAAAQRGPVFSLRSLSKLGRDENQPQCHQSVSPSPSRVHHFHSETDLRDLCGTVAHKRLCPGLPALSLHHRLVASLQMPDLSATPPLSVWIPGEVHTRQPVTLGPEIQSGQTFLLGPPSFTSLRNSLLRAIPAHTRSFPCQCLCTSCACV